jgi:YVTN family beta-propeller protein
MKAWSWLLALALAGWNAGNAVRINPVFSAGLQAGSPRGCAASQHCAGEAETTPGSIGSPVRGGASPAVQPSSPRPPRPGVSEAHLRIPMSRLKPDSVFDIPGVPDWQAIDEHVWVSNSPKGTVTRIDPGANKIVETITVGKNPCSGLTTGFGSLWVPNCGDPSLSRVDLKTGKVVATLPLTVGNSEGGVASGAGSVWMMIDAKGTLVRIDPATNKVVAEIYVAPGSFAVAFGEGAVWVTGTEKGVLTRVNASNHVIEDVIAVGPRPRFLAVGEGSVWTVNQGDGTISRVDAKTNKVVATIAAGIPGPGGEIAVGEGSVWVTSFEYPITRIDPATNKVVQQFYGEGGDAIRVGHGSVWLSNLRQGNVWRLDPRRIAATMAETP